jgi:hypothetical protein
VRGLGIGAFGEEPMNRLNLQTLKSLHVAKDAPKLRDELYVLWAKDAENTESIKRLKQIIKKELPTEGTTS